MRCTVCNREIPEGSFFCNNCGKKLNNNDLSNPLTEIKELPIPEIEKEEAQWGMHINQNDYSADKKCPDWLNPSQRECWTRRGIIVWDKKAPQVTKLWASQGIQLLKNYRESDEWKENGIVVGEPALEIQIENKQTRRKEPTPPHESKWVITHQIKIDENQCLELFVFLDKNKKMLQTMVTEDEKEQDRVFGETFDLLRDLGEKIRSGDKSA